ncbi:MAG: NAD(P)-dependent oxidoreductase [Pseudomonadota bacterium]
MDKPAQANGNDPFSDLHPPLTDHEALVAADRCYFCYDAPCVTACPTDIDIPLFIRQISTGKPMNAAETILEQNIMGGMCARVCPTEDLCEQACVRGMAEGKPVQIGLLQRYATDTAMAEDRQFFERAEPSGKKVAVVGAGPAGLACAHGLAVKGHEVTVYEAAPKPGGLNEYGIAAYKAVDDFAQREVDYITAIGGIEIKYQKRLGRDIALSDLQGCFSAVFLGIGLGDTNVLGQGEELTGVEDAVDFISRLRQADNKDHVKVGRRVVVIGGGMTAVDAAVQSKLLGAQEVTICYRRGQEHMNASTYEQDLAASKGVTIRHWVAPKKIKGKDGKVKKIKLDRMAINGDGKLEATGETLTLKADMILTAIGQKLEVETVNETGLDLAGNRIATVGAHGQTNLEKVWAGGDCVAGGDDLTVTAVAQGRDAAKDIHAFLSGQHDQ